MFRQEMEKEPSGGFPLNISFPVFTEVWATFSVPYIRAFSPLSQHQDLFQRVGSSHQVAKVLDIQLQYQSFQ